MNSMGNTGRSIGLNAAPVQGPPTPGLLQNVATGLKSVVSNAAPFVGSSLLATGAIGAGLAFNSWGASRKVIETNSFVPTFQIPEDVPPLPQDDDFGGAKDIVIASLTGVSNKENRWGDVPMLFGIDVEFHPPLAVQPAVSATSTYQTISGIFECGPGELEFKEPKIDGRAISEYPSVVVEYQYGKADDAALSYYTQATATAHPGAELKNEAVSTLQKAGRKASRLDITIAFPDGLYERQVTGNVSTLVNRAVSFYIVIRGENGGGAVVTDYPNAVAKQAEPYFFNKTYFVTEGEYEVLIARVMSPESTDPNIQDTAVWTDLVASSTGPIFYPHKNSVGETVHMARIGYRAQATENLQGTLGDFSIKGSSKLPAWDGTNWTEPAASNNPAWIICKLLRGPQNYIPVPDERIDLARFKEFADWCTEKGFIYNKVIEGGQSLFEVCQEVAAAGRACFYMRDGKCSVLIDKPVETVAQHFTPRNIIVDTFGAEYDFTEGPDYLSVPWVNPDKDNQQDVRDVYDDGKTEGVDFKNESVTFPGVNKSDIIYKLARYLLATNRLRTRLIQFAADIEYLRCEIGDRIKLTHHRLGMGLGQGRITAVTTDGGGDITSISLDAAQTMDSDSSFELQIRLHNGESVTVPINNGNVKTKTFTLTTPLPSASVNPSVGDLVSFGVTEQSARDMLILRIEPAENLSATIFCVDYAPQIYEADAGVIPPFTSIIDRPRRLDRTVGIPKILYAQSNEEVLERGGDGSYVTKILLTLEAPTTPVTDYAYQYSRAGENAWSVPNVVAATGGYLSVYGVQDGLFYDVRVQARRGNFRSDDWGYVLNHEVIGKTTPPPSVTALYKLPGGNRVGWPEIVRPRDFAGYRVYMAWGDNESTEQATVLVDLTDSTQWDLGHFARGLKTIMVTAVDVAGNESVTPAVLKMDFGDVETDNAVIETDEHPLWTGTKSNCSIVSGALKADDYGTNFYGPDEGALFYTNDDADNVYDVLYKEATYLRSFTPPSDYAFPYRWYLNLDIEASGYKVEYQTLSDSNFYSEAPGADDEPMYDADGGADFYQQNLGEWLPFPTNGFEFTAVVTVNLRITLFGGVYQGVINSLTHVLDMPDLVVYYDDFAVSAAGTRLPTAGVFHSVYRVQLAVQGATGKLYTVDEKDSALGPIVRLFDRATGAGVAGVIDAEVRGIA